MKANHYRRWLTLFLLCLPLVAQAKPALWQAQRNNQTLYLFGSIHVGTNKLYPLPKKTLEAFGESRQLWVEVDTRHISDSTRAKIQELIHLKAGQKLDQIIPASLYQSLKTKAQQLHLSMPQLETITPWYISIILNQQFYQQLGYDSSLGIDQYFLSLASKAQKPVRSLETVTAQFQALAKLKKDQIELLRESLNTNDAMKKTLDEIVSAWRSGKEEQLTKLLANDQSSSNKDFSNNILKQRNRQWLRKLTQIKAPGKQFIVVGALHLSGPDGLVQLLEKAGYHVKKIS
ncbi:TraB/GumN family protein [Celerinatantimonas sp. MCCC 1A17872]|uniref:TraB/GumN family protein n=1 Tax=Celerinatantimonas sp. MCCC 1A17872 TaxID=3177514 RepID=UPI0038C1762F